MNRAGLERPATRHAAQAHPQEIAVMRMMAGFFDPEWYEERYPDVAAASLDPLYHFIRYGLAEWRDPNRFFDSAWYVEQNPDVRASGMHPLLHYFQWGASELRNPNPHFDAAWYAAEHPDSALNPLVYHLTTGLAFGYSTEAAEPRKIAARFESLGGGSLHPGGWAFGCEFGFWQRSLGLEPLGLLRWASISPEDLLRGLQAGFAGVEYEAALLMREHTAFDWGYTQTDYRMVMDHSGMLRNEISAGVARAKLARYMGFLRDKLLADLACGEKLFVYRTYDHTLDERMQLSLADAVSHFGKGILFYVQLAAAGRPAFTAVRKAPNLIVGYIDKFAPRDGELIYNSAGWEQVCRAALDIWIPPVA